MPFPSQCIPSIPPNCLLSSDEAMPHGLAEVLTSVEHRLSGSARHHYLSDQYSEELNCVSIFRPFKHSHNKLPLLKWTRYCSEKIFLYFAASSGEYQFDLMILMRLRLLKSLSH